MRTRIATPIALLGVLLLVGCASTTREGRARETELPATSSAPTVSGTATIAPPPIAKPADSTKTYPGLMRVWDVARTCGASQRLNVHFKAGLLQTSTVRMQVRSADGITFRSTTHTLPVVQQSHGDGALSFRGTRTTWELTKVSGGTPSRDVSQGWTVALLSAQSGRILVHPDSVVVPSCTRPTWHAPPITLLVSQVERDCATYGSNDFSARLQASGLVYGQLYVVYGTAEGYGINNRGHNSTTYDEVQHFSPMPDLRPSETASLPKPFPKTTFTAKIRVETEAREWFDTDEKSEYATVQVPAC